jgi:hypothetical protein
MIIIYIFGADAHLAAANAAYSISHLTVKISSTPPHDQTDSSVLSWLSRCRRHVLPSLLLCSGVVSWVSEWPIHHRITQLPRWIGDSGLANCVYKTVLRNSATKVVDPLPLVHCIPAVVQSEASSSDGNSHVIIGPFGRTKFLNPRVAQSDDAALTMMSANLRYKRSAFSVLFFFNQR